MPNVQRTWTADEIVNLVTNATKQPLVPSDVIAQAYKNIAKVPVITFQNTVPTKKPVTPATPAVATPVTTSVATPVTSSSIASEVVAGLSPKFDALIAALAKKE